MKFIQITANRNGLFALDELGRVWFWPHALRAPLEGWQCLGSVPEAERRPGGGQ